jgi:hypothetical protein
MLNRKEEEEKIDDHISMMLIEIITIHLLKQKQRVRNTYINVTAGG